MYINGEILNRFVAGVGEKHVPKCTHKISTMKYREKLIKHLSHLRLIKVNEILSATYQRQLRDGYILFEKLQDRFKETL